MATQSDTVRALLDRHGRTFAEELRIDVAKSTPSPLYRLLCAAMLMSARIGSPIAVEAAAATAGFLRALIPDVANGAAPNARPVDETEGAPCDHDRRAPAAFLGVMRAYGHRCAIFLTSTPRASPLS